MVKFLVFVLSHKTLFLQKQSKKYFPITAQRTLDICVKSLKEADLEDDDDLERALRPYTDVVFSWICKLLRDELNRQDRFFRQDFNLFGGYILKVFL